MYVLTWSVRQLTASVTSLIMSVTHFTMSVRQLTTSVTLLITSATHHTYSWTSDNGISPQRPVFEVLNFVFDKCSEVVLYIMLCYVKQSRLAISCNSMIEKYIAIRLRVDELVMSSIQRN